MVVGLVNEQKLTAFTMSVILVPVLVVFLDRHGRALLHRLENVLILMDRVLEQFAVLILIIVVKNLFQLINIVSEAIRQAHD